MATKAEKFRADQQRTAHQPKPKRAAPRSLRDAPTDATKPPERNRSLRAGRKGGAELEVTRSGRPSRKSTRKSQGRVKRTDNLRRKALRKAGSATAKAAGAASRRR
jgi:hypothetical protein